MVISVKIHKHLIYLCLYSYCIHDFKTKIHQGDK